jgi:hypothetical protein
MRKLVLFSAIFMTFTMSCKKKNTAEPQVTLSISGKINCPKRTLTALNPSEYLITLVDSTGFIRETRPTADCKYSFDNLEFGHNYNIKIAKTGRPSTGPGPVRIEVYLSQNPLPKMSDLGLKAADVDKNGEVDATDVLHIKRFNQGLTQSLPTGTFWLFVPNYWLDFDNNFAPNQGRWHIPNLTTNVTNFDMIQAAYSDIELILCN